MKHKILIIGAGNVGTALQTGLSRAGCDVRLAKREIAETDLKIIRNRTGLRDS